MTTMTTPKTPFRGRQSPTETNNNGRDMVVGVVSRDSNDAADASQGTPQPSPVQPPAPQARGGRQSTESKASRQHSRPENTQEDAHSLAESVPSQLEVPPPSPYSPPAESLWSENTEDQWPRNHTKRNFRRPGPSPTDAPASTKPNRRQEYWLSHHAASGSTSAYIPPLDEVALPSSSSETPYQQDPYEPVGDHEPGATMAYSAGVPAPTPRRESRVPPPSSSRLRYTTTPSVEDALFLLQEEHKILQNEYQHLDEEWKDKCENLEGKVMEQEEMMKRLQTALTNQNEETKQTRGYLEYSRDEWEKERARIQDDFDKQMADQTLQCENLREDLEASHKEKRELEAEMSKLQKSAEQLLDGKEEDAKALHEKNATLQDQKETLQKKVDHYEGEIVRQSKQILQLEEALEDAKNHADKEVRSIQSEALALGNDWKAEKQSLQEEIQNLKEQLAEKDMETAKLMDEQRRQQARQVQDLEQQVIHLTNDLAEYQGRHRELRNTVDQHLKSVIWPTKNTVSASCQTEENTELDGASSPAETTAETTRSTVDTSPSEPSPSTPSVRFDETGTSGSVRSFAGSTPASALRNHTKSPHDLSSHTNRSASPVSPPLSEHCIPSTPGPAVSPWIPTWQGRSLHARADPPPSSTPQSSRSLSPPAASHSTATTVEQSRRAPLPPTCVGEEPSAEGGRLVDRVPTPPTERTSNVDRASLHRKEQTEKVCDDLIILFYFRE